MARPRNNTKITIEGNPNCKHLERLDSNGHVGVCARCGRTKVYSDGGDYDKSLQTDFSFQGQTTYWDRVARNTDIGVKTW